MGEVIQVLIDRFDFLWELTQEHMMICLIAILFSTIVGILMGIVASEYKKTRFLLFVVNVVYTLPAISMLGFLIPVTGIGNTTAIVALSIYGLLPMVKNTYTGMNTIDPSVLEAAEGMGTNQFQIIYKIKFPLALPVILTGFKNMVIMTIALAGIASFVGAGGLGVAIYRGITTNNTALNVAGSLLIAILALVSDFMISLVETKLKKEKMV